MSDSREARGLIREVLDRPGRVDAAEKIAAANALATLALVDALRNPAAPVPPGPCWNDSGSVWFGNRPRCELLAGHAGAHVWRDGNGGERVWPNRTGGQEAER